MVALAAADTAAAAAAAAAATAAVHPGVVNLQISLAMARLCHRRAAKCRERCESRGEDLHPFEGVRIIPFFAFVTIAALAAAAAAAAPTTCATRDIVYHWARHR